MYGWMILTLWLKMMNLKAFIQIFLAWEKVTIIRWKRRMQSKRMISQRMPMFITLDQNC